MLKRILIAEDDVMLCDVWRLAFERAGFQVYTVHNGKAAIQWLDENPLPDAVVTDHNMPLRNGEAVLRHVHQIDPDQRVKKLLISANSAVKYGDLDNLADLTLLKPVHYHDMVQFVQRFCT